MPYLHHKNASYSSAKNLNQHSKQESDMPIKITKPIRKNTKDMLLHRIKNLISTDSFIQILKIPLQDPFVIPSKTP
jgi:hypothetical protein